MGNPEGLSKPLGWRTLQEKDWQMFIGWLEVTYAEREKLGAEKYNSRENGFIGDPFKHLGEELLDALFYWYTENRRREEELNNEVPAHSKGS